MDDRKYHQAGLVAGRLCAFIATKIAWASFTKYHQSILVLFSPIPLWTASQGLEWKTAFSKSKVKLTWAAGCHSNIIRSRATIKANKQRSDKTPAKCFKGGTGWCLEWKWQHVWSKVPHSIGPTALALFHPNSNCHVSRSYSTIATFWQD